MKVAVFSTKPYDRSSLDGANTEHGHELVYFDARLSAATAPLARGCEAVCAFVNDELNATVLEELHRSGVRFVALRCAGYNNVDHEVAERHRLVVARVPAYSPYAVAEHTVALILSLNRKIYRAYNRVREGNFTLDGLLGFDLHGRTIGVIGTGQIGLEVARIMRGFGCQVLAYDIKPNPECESLQVRYVSLEDLLAKSDIITLHCPLTPSTRHLIDTKSLQTMKPGVMIINTGRGSLVDTEAVIAGLKSAKIGYLGLDVYEEEADLFFEDHSGQVIHDDVFARLLTFPNVLITGHQAFFTREALQGIATTTLANLTEFAENGTCSNAVPSPKF
ncbi:2-hydroxyacid dehydrogenase [Singulisphaera acidiphila]|uniref:Lactate dehydrogenase-like oxidoreductase n=1 Tax=Singulisphaera acidiphila (strain ATCC BAA-1392 / DSM 18658 / VKM B-2454 / MOB10) TaxID=886293 RepID=L0DEJ0_SINAD|nr:2-hydroxyacid dehydrogenase [Singulisphaera acidiphila]AGA27076.1 lactate dehydrogenase-like oxidoreductase [Singulisphaera acidiphila DSM 18658]